MLLPEKLIDLLQENNIPIDKFNHFDYVEMFEQLGDLDLQNHPKKKKIVEQFAQKCFRRLNEDDKYSRRVKTQNFLKRMEMHQELKKQKLEALRFIANKYDSENRQLLFYPKLNLRKATQRNRCWKDIDGIEDIEEQGNIFNPNESIVQHDKDRSVWQDSNVK